MVNATCDCCENFVASGVVLSSGEVYICKHTEKIWFRGIDIPDWCPFVVRMKGCDSSMVEENFIEWKERVEDWKEAWGD